MKKLTYLFVAAAALGMVACGGNKPGYVITGTVEGAADGDTVFLQEVVGRQLSKLDTAIIKNGTFTFEGVQDSAVNRYVTSGTGNEAMLMDFFLENGKINIALTNNDSATGTATTTLPGNTQQDQRAQSESTTHLRIHGKCRHDRRTEG